MSAYVGAVAVVANIVENQLALLEVRPLPDSPNPPFGPIIFSSVCTRTHGVCRCRSDVLQWSYDVARIFDVAGSCDIIKRLDVISRYDITWSDVIIWRFDVTQRYDVITQTRSDKVVDFRIRRRTVAVYCVTLPARRRWGGEPATTFDTTAVVTGQAAHIVWCTVRRNGEIPLRHQKGREAMEKLRYFIISGSRRNGKIPLRHHNGPRSNGEVTLPHNKWVPEEWGNSITSS